jgi:hypothetical protein
MDVSPEEVKLFIEKTESNNLEFNDFLESLISFLNNETAKAIPVTDFINTKGIVNSQNIKSVVDLKTESKLNNLNIIYDNAYKDGEDSGFPIALTENENQPYFCLSMGEDYTVRFFINNIDKENEYVNKYSCPKGYFIYDYFGSGELYINIPEDKYIVSVRPTFKTLYFNHITNGMMKEYPSNIGHKPTSFAESCISPSSDHLSDNPLYAWKMSIDTFFNTVDASEIDGKNQKVIKKSPVCKYLTLHNDQHNITSEYYNFGNIIQNRSVCSCPKMGSKTSITPCHVVDMMSSIPAESACASYVPLSKVIRTISVCPQNTEQQTNIQMRYSTTMTKEHSFIIENLTAQTILSALQFPSDLPYEDIITEVNGIFDELTSCYVPDDVNESSVIDTKEEVSKISYIQTLLGV